MPFSTEHLRFPIDDKKFIKRQEELLQIERNAFFEDQKQDESFAESIRVIVMGHTVPKYGGAIVKFKIHPKVISSPSFPMGSTIEVDLMDGFSSLSGILVANEGKYLDIHLNDSIELFENDLEMEVTKIPYDGDYQQYQNALNKLRKEESRLKDILFGKCEPRILESEPVSFINSVLDKSQRDAVELVQRNQDIAIIHGPPGTGKTTTLVEVIQQVCVTILTCDLLALFLFRLNPKALKFFFLLLAI